jgi:hypothetical protein
LLSDMRFGPTGDCNQPTSIVQRFGWSTASAVQLRDIGKKVFMR